VKKNSLGPGAFIFLSALVIVTYLSGWKISNTPEMTIKPIMPYYGHANSRYGYHDTWYYWDEKEEGQEYVDQHKSATIVYRTDYVYRDWFYRHIMIEADNGARLSTIEARDTPFADSNLSIGDQVALAWRKGDNRIEFLP